MISGAQQAALGRFIELDLDFRLALVHSPLQFVRAVLSQIEALELLARGLQVIGQRARNQLGRGPETRGAHRDIERETQLLFRVEYFLEAQHQVLGLLHVLKHSWTGRGDDDQ